MSEDEAAIRKQLAACYRLAARFGMADLISTHISAAVPGSENILINRYGLLFHEITASNLLLIPIDGVAPADVNPAGALIHTAIHGARPDVGCIMHTHTAAGVAVSCQANGLLPLSQHALQFHGGIGYHAYEGIALIEEEKARLIADLGEHRVLILRNHGLLVAGRTVAETFTLMFNLEHACQIQLRAQASGVPLTYPSREICALTARQHEGFAGQPVGLAEWTALIRDLRRTDPEFED